MRLLITCLLFVFSNYASGQCGRKIAVTGKVTFERIYKGGARPTPEMLVLCCSPRPYSNASLYLKKNYYSEDTILIHTDSAGTFNAKLKPGRYHIYISNEFNKEKSALLEAGKYDDQQKWLTEPYATLEIKKKGERNFTLSLKERMNNEILPP